VRKGEKINAISHMAGAALALAGLVALVVAASLARDPWRIVGFSIYGSSLVALYVLSTLYHGLGGQAGREVFRRLDHGAIYFLIAGTYTPFTLVTLRSAWGWTIFGIVWGGAIAGVLLEIFPFRYRRPVSVALYVLMGWIIVIAFRPLVARLQPGGIFWLLAGGVLYTGGLAFYGWKSLPRHHEIWHFFVLAASACHFVALWMYVR
jgi:hemolysin III